MSRPTGASTAWTYSEYARLPDDGNRYEVIDGEVCVTPAHGPPHQEVAANLYIALRAYLDSHGLGKVFWDVDLLFVSGQFLRPDLLVVPTDALEGVTDRGVERAPSLVVEVLSPHSASIDRVKKPPRYKDFGIPEYWVVDRESRAVEVYRFASGATEPEVVTDVLRWQPDPSAPAMELPVQEVFRGV